MDVAELATAAGLLLVAALLRDLSADRLAVRDARFGGHHADVEAAQQLLDGNVDLEVAHAGDDRLVEIPLHADVERRVLLTQAMEPGAHLLVLPLRLRRDGDLVVRRGERDGSQDDRVRLVAERLPGVRLAELHRGADVAGADVGRVDAILPAKDVELPDLLRALRAGVEDFLAVVEFSREDADERNVARLALAARLEDERRQRAGGVDLQFHLLAVPRLRARDGAEVGRRGEEIEDRVEEEIEPQERHRGQRERRHEIAMKHSLAKSEVDLLHRQVGAAQEFFEERVVRLGGRVDQRRAGFLHVRLDVRRDRRLLQRALLLEEERLVRREIDEAAELVPFTDGPRDRDEALPQLLARPVDRLREGGVLLVHLRHGAKNGTATLLDTLPHGFRTRLDTGGSLEAEHRGVGRFQPGDEIADEVSVPGRVDEIDLLVLPFDRGEREADGDSSVLLFRGEVEGRAAVLDLPLARDRLRAEERGFSERGFPRPMLGRERDVPDLARQVLFQGRPQFSW